MTSSATLPPPLSDSPSVETLERLLVGLHEPMQRGVPSPPPPDRLLDVTVLEQATDPFRDGPAPSTVASAPTVEPVDASRSWVPPSLSWSAGTRRGLRSRPAATALGVAVVSAAGLVAGLAAAGELSLP